MTPLNPEQLGAVEAEGEVFVSAGAGTGKTSVLVERFVRAVCDRGIDVDSVLVITYTRKAAGELRRRIREELVARGRRDLARQLDGAWISTIHGFCARLLRAHPFAVGIDPRFRELDEAQGAVVRGEAFERALEEFCAGRDPERLRLLATYGADGLRRTLTGVYEKLRSAGRDLVLELGERPDLQDRLQELLTGFAGEYAAAKARESALDFEDLQLLARDLLCDDVAVREAEQLRFRLIMVDEFQDTNRLQCELIDLLAAGPAKEVFFVGDEFQSIYGFRHADVQVFRERREQAPQLLALTRNYRSRPEVLAAVNELFGSDL